MTALGETVSYDSLSLVGGGVGIVDVGVETLQEVSAPCCIEGNFSLSFDGHHVADIELGDKATTNSKLLEKVLKSVIVEGKWSEIDGIFTRIILRVILTCYRNKLPRLVGSEALVLPYRLAPAFAKIQSVYQIYVRQMGPDHSRPGRSPRRRLYLEGDVRRLHSPCACRRCSAPQHILRCH